MDHGAQHLAQLVAQGEDGLHVSPEGQANADGDEEMGLQLVEAALRDTLLPRLISGELRVKDAERSIGSTV